jgi:hypothetical protein
MRYLKLKFLLLGLLFISMNAVGQVVYFNGLGRALVTNNKIGGNLLDTNKTDQRKATGGYTLFDLGINVQPSELLKASAVLRIKNEFGGFYGDGTTLNFRQFKVEGLISRKVKFQIGDLDLMLSPYTLFNFNTSYHQFESDLFAIQRSIVNYENFNNGNNWRLQGAQAETKLKFKKIIERVGINAFATRIRGNDYILLKDPNRMLVGGRIDVVQSNFFTTGVNYIDIFDMAGTALDSTVKFNNQVVTNDFKFNVGGDKLGLQVFGEYGTSNYQNKKAADLNELTKQDYFYDLGTSIIIKPQALKLSVSYRNVGADFSSPGAQTRRIFDTGTPSLFPVVGQPRQPILIDRISDMSLRNPAIRDTLISYNPKYNNITPYGTATPNRKGITIGLKAGEEEKLYTAELTADVLQEIVGEGGRDVRKYVGLSGGFKLNAHKILQWEKIVKPSVGFRTEQTTRNSNDPALSGNSINLNSYLIDIGLTIEIIKNLDFIVGYKALFAKGNEIYAPRNEYNVIDPSKLLTFNYNSSESMTAAGLKYRFSKNTFFTGQYYLVDFKDKLNTVGSYTINQLFLNYTMIF